MFVADSTQFGVIADLAEGWIFVLCRSKRGEIKEVLIPSLSNCYSLKTLSSTGSATHGPALHEGPKNLAEALIRDSAKDMSSSHSRATRVDSKY